VLVTYRELTSPLDVSAPIVVRVLRGSPEVIAAVLIAWVLGEIVGAIAARRIVLAGEGVAAALRGAIATGLRHPLRTLIRFGLPAAVLALVLGPSVVAAGSAWSAVDGALARATGGSTAFGSFLDSTLDRAAEAILYVAIVVYFVREPGDPLWPVVLALAALSASFMVSYTRAKAEAIGVSASVGLAPRTERLVLVVAGIALAGLGFEIGLIGAVGIIAALAVATTVQRIWHVWRQVDEIPAAASIGEIQER